MVAIEDVIQELKSAEAGSRLLDSRIGLLVGYHKADENIHPKNSWIHPDGKVAYLPQFTTSIDAAYSLSKRFSESSGFVHTGEIAKARVGTSPVAHAATPAVALCLATLMFTAGHVSSDA